MRAGEAALLDGETKEHHRKNMGAVLDYLKGGGNAEAKKRTAQGKSGGPSIRAMETKPEPAACGTIPRKRTASGCARQDSGKSRILRNALESQDSECQGQSA